MSILTVLSFIPRFVRPRNRRSKHSRLARQKLVSGVKNLSCASQTRLARQKLARRWSPHLYMTGAENFDFSSVFSFRDRFVCRFKNRFSIRKPRLVQK